MRKVIADFESGKFPLRIEIIEDRTTGYAAVSEIIEKWYQLNGYGGEMSFVVTIEIDDYVETVFVTRFESGDYEWECDWWEGAKDFKLLGFCPIINAYLEIRGYPEIEEMPFADVVEVVRCKNCKYYISGTCRCIIDGTERYCEVRKPSDYCSYGERKES